MDDVVMTRSAETAKVKAKKEPKNPEVKAKKEPKNPEVSSEIKVFQMGAKVKKVKVTKYKNGVVKGHLMSVTKKNRATKQRQTP